MAKAIVKKPDLKVGDNVTIQKTVTSKDAALKYGTGKLHNLLATPSLVGLMIEASVKLIDTKLIEGFISVGKRVVVVHEKPTTIGETVSINVEIDEIDNNRYHLVMKAYDESGLIGTGEHTRTIVNERWMMLKLERRKSMIESHDF
jgi:predicted thioesterase